MSEEKADLVNVTVDGVPVTVPAGTLVIEAAEHAGVVVPHYCYHPGIPTSPAQCRVCLVEVEGQGKLQPSCVMPVQDGMVVHTQSEVANQARKSVIEFLLLNHPLDCPICDAAGQCMLQDYASETGQLQSRFDDAKLVLGRDRVADDILYFADRCIICTRCVRFMRDVAGDDSLIVAQRGHQAYIDTFPGKNLENEFRGNIVDVCPVGALVHEDFVFKARAWDLDSTPSICPGCSTGCNVNVDVKENQIVRLKPRYNADVNSYWMCDYGRSHLVMSNRGLRVEVPLVRSGGRLEAVSWDEAFAWLAETLRDVRSGSAIVSPHESNEGLYFFSRLASILGIEGGSYRLERGSEAELKGLPQLKLRAERAPNAWGAEEFGFAEVESLTAATSERTLVLGDALAGCPEDFAAESDGMIYFGSRPSPAARNASAVLPITTFAEMSGTVTNADGRVQRFRQALQPPGVARPAWMVLSRLLAEMGHGEAALNPQDALAAMASGSPVMAGLTWEGLGDKGAALPGAAQPALAEEPGS